MPAPPARDRPDPFRPAIKYNIANKYICKCVHILVHVLALVCIRRCAQSIIGCIISTYTCMYYGASPGTAAWTRTIPTAAAKAGAKTCRRRRRFPLATSRTTTGCTLAKGEARQKMIDIIEGMMGDSNGTLPGTRPNVSLPYVDMTLQVAPGIPENRPQTGHPPLKEDILTDKGFTEFAAQTWYDDLIFHGNTSINPFFYGTYLGETKKGEPVTRTKKEAFQADAVGAMHQLVPAHFRRMHTFRIEWQPGPGGRIDWFTKGKKGTRANSTEAIDKDTEWVLAFTLKDDAIKSVMGSQIPNEPSYLIFNTAISSTWGFPYDVPSYCPKCYDCSNVTCACAFYPGFCQMMKKGVAMSIDHVRVYQSKNDSAHVGNPHTLGCDPPEYPTREFIKGHEYRYMRQPPWGLEDKYPLRKIKRGGGSCVGDQDCGADHGQGKCVQSLETSFFGSVSKFVCECSEGYTGPSCLVIDHVDDSSSAYAIKLARNPLNNIPNMLAPQAAVVFALVLIAGFFATLFVGLVQKPSDSSSLG